MTPFASVAMLEKLALLKIALWRAAVVSKAAVRRTSVLTSAVSERLFWVVGMFPPVRLSGSGRCGAHADDGDQGKKLRFPDVVRREDPNLELPGSALCVHSRPLAGVSS